MKSKHILSTLAYLRTACFFNCHSQSPIRYFSPDMGITASLLSGSTKILEQGLNKKSLLGLLPEMLFLGSFIYIDSWAVSLFLMFNSAAAKYYIELSPVTTGTREDTMALVNANILALDLVTLGKLPLQMGSCLLNMAALMYDYGKNYCSLRQASFQVPTDGQSHPSVHR